MKPIFFQSIWNKNIFRLIGNVDFLYQILYCFLFSSLLFLPLAIFFYLISLLIYYLMCTFRNLILFPTFYIYKFSFLFFFLSLSFFSLYIYSIFYFVRSKVFLFFSLSSVRSLFLPISNTCLPPFSLSIKEFLQLSQQTIKMMRSSAYMTPIRLPRLNLIYKPVWWKSRGLDLRIPCPLTDGNASCAAVNSRPFQRLIHKKKCWERIRFYRFSRRFGHFKVDLLHWTILLFIF